MNKNLIASIITYNPEIHRLKDNIDLIRGQVDDIIVIDNGSKNIQDIKDILQEQDVCVENGKNLGIAVALNKALTYAKNNQYKWILTLDQDSICDVQLVEHYMSYVDLDNVGILTCKIKDRNFDISYDDENAEYTEIKSCITSGSFCNVEALDSVGGFDDQMFIDGVDFDICANLRKYGYRIYRINFLGLFHEVGHGKNVKLLWKKCTIYNHNSFRNYYMARNSVYLSKKYPQEYPMFRTIIREIKFEILILKYEEHKVAKLKARWKGLLDVRKMSI